MKKVILFLLIVFMVPCSGISQKKTSAKARAVSDSSSMPANNFGRIYISKDDTTYHLGIGNHASIGLSSSGLSGYWQKSGANLYYNDGKIGIGTTSPARSLEVYGTSSPILSVKDDSNIETFMQATGTVAKVGALGTAADFIIYNGGDRVSVQNDGTVGIGTTDPDAILDVEGFKSADTLLKVSNDTDFDPDSSIFFHPSGAVSIGVKDPSFYKMFVDGTIYATSIGVQSVTASSIIRGNSTIFNLTSGTYTNSSGINKVLSIAPTMNESGTSGNTIFYIDVTETAIGSGDYYAIDLNWGGSRIFSVDKDGDVTIAGDLTVSGSESYHADMYFNTNATAQTPTAGDTIGMTQFTQGDLSGFSFDAGSNGTYTAVADKGSGTQIRVFASGHGLSTGDWVVLSDGNYDGVYEATVTHVDSIIVTATWGATDAGNWWEPSRLTLTATGITSGSFRVDWNISASVAGTPSGDQVEWGCYVNTSPKINTWQQRTLSTGSVFGSFGNGGIVTLSTNDDVFMVFLSDDVNALTHKFGTLRIEQL